MMQKEIRDSRYPVDGRKSIPNSYWRMEEETLILWELLQFRFTESCIDY
jgi:hypothetical protein